MEIYVRLVFYNEMQFVYKIRYAKSFSKTSLKEGREIRQKK